MSCLVIFVFKKIISPFFMPLPACLLLALVVLGGGSSVDPSLPASTCLSDASLFRVSEGVYIHNRLPETKLILTGMSRFDGMTPMAEVMGKGRRSVVREDWGRHT